MNSDFPIRHFQFSTYQLAYRVIGNGPLILLAFHGFGQDSSVFTTWQPIVGQRYTIYAIDLFFHGESQLADGEVLTKTTWQSLIDAFLQNHKINEFSVAGFSLGGGFAIAIAEQYAHRLEQLILIAPDGITRSRWYRLATSTALGRLVFRSMLRHLSLINGIGHSLTSVGLIHRTVMKFAEVSLATSPQRQQVYKSWVTFRFVHADLPRLATVLNHEAVRVRFFTGYFDKIVPEHYTRPLTRRLYSYELTVLKTGHSRLTDQVARLL